MEEEAPVPRIPLLSNLFLLVGVGLLMASLVLMVRGTGAHPLLPALAAICIASTAFLDRLHLSRS